MMRKISTDKISNPESIRVKRHTDVKKSGGEALLIKNKPSAGQDKLNLSDRASEARKFASEVFELPELREEKIVSLRAKIRSGEFKPSGAAIADAILKDEKV